MKGYLFYRSRSTQITKPEIRHIQDSDRYYQAAADDMEKVEADLCNKELLNSSKDIQETDRLLAEFDALEWLQGQIAVQS